MKKEETLKAKKCVGFEEQPSLSKAHSFLSILNCVTTQQTKKCPKLVEK